jgi:DNA (cytosine-5)-methyltransferase 1
MLRVIQITKPTWIIAENVRGLVTWNEGMVLEQVCTDLEAEGYEVQPFIVPACAINAPHRRDRVWIIANRKGGWLRGSKPKGGEWRESQKKVGNGNSDASDSKLKRLQESQHQYNSQNREKIKTRLDDRFERQSWDQDWTQVATKFCSLDDGLSVELDELKLTKAQNRVEQLKAYGNAIVPAVAVQIMEAISYTEKQDNL